MQQAHPDRFAIVKSVDQGDPGAADVIADRKKTRGAVRIRTMLTKEANRGQNDPGLYRIARAARHDLPVKILFWGNPDAGTTLIDRYLDTRFIIDQSSRGLYQLRVMHPDLARPAGPPRVSTRKR